MNDEKQEYDEDDDPPYAPRGNRVKYESKIVKQSQKVTDFIKKQVSIENGAKKKQKDPEDYDEDDAWGDVRRAKENIQKYNIKQEEEQTYDNNPTTTPSFNFEFNDNRIE